MISFSGDGGLAMMLGDMCVFFDLDRVGMLKGLQRTFYGRDATDGIGVVAILSFRNCEEAARRLRSAKRWFSGMER